MAQPNMAKLESYWHLVLEVKSFFLEFHGVDSSVSLSGGFWVWLAVTVRKSQNAWTHGDWAQKVAWVAAIGFLKMSIPHSITAELP